MNRLQLCFVVCSLTCLAIVGCGDSGPELGRVTGTVTMDGQPLANALVTFVPEAGGRSSTGTTDSSGNYTLIYADKKGALIGRHKVSVTTIQTVDDEVDMSEIPSDDPRYAELMAKGEDAYNEAQVTEPIPAKYNTNSELAEEVSSGSNTINLDLTSS